jgi:hypothetical protein
VTNEWRKKHPERYAAMQAKYYENHKDERREKLYAYRTANPEKMRAYRKARYAARTPEQVEAEQIRKRAGKFRRKYGITIDEYNTLLAKQAGVCALCRHPTRRGTYGGNLDVDHDHATGKVRGLLCTSCNHALGVLGDNVEGLELALKYLKCQ